MEGQHESWMNDECNGLFYLEFGLKLHILALSLADAAEVKLMSSNLLLCSVLLSTIPNILPGTDALSEYIYKYCNRALLFKSYQELGYQ